ncbi:MAG: 3-ketoacyl-ACP reductase [Planctomycetia bacterium]|nr:3-ketoacyl-ACP reductase [Planctomycetia bacterium]
MSSVRQPPVALVTGGSRGIGRGICLALAQSGYAVAVNYAGNEAAAQETERLLQALPGSPPTLRCQADVGQSADRERLVETVLAQWGRIDVLVNNAGITSPGRRDILEASEDGWDQVLAINLKGPFFLTQRVAREMIRLQNERQVEVGRQNIINISSLSAYAPATNRGDYCISKAGMRMMTQLWALRLADHGIRVYEVCPGVIETDMTAAAKEKYTPLIEAGLSPIRRWGTAEDVGKTVAALVSGTFPFSTGDVINVDGGFHIRKFPST